MVFAVDVEDHVVRRWYRDGETARFERDTDWTPSIYVSGQKPEYLEWLEPRLVEDPKVVDVATVQKRPQLQDYEPEDVLRVDVERPTEIEQVAQEVARRSCDQYLPGSLRLHNVDFAPKFRYCLETETDPTPTEEFRQLAFSLDERALAHQDVTALECDGEQLGDTEEAVLEAVDERLQARDPDVLVLSSGDVVPLVEDRAAELGLDVHFGRLPERKQLSSESTYHSYGRTGYSPARYDVAGRAIVDTSNSFLWDDGGLPGLLDLVERSRKPLQEASWGSIGNLFTSIQIRTALDRDVIVQWRPRETERWKPLDTLHDADRGAFIFQPEVGFHEDVVELDFSSLFPNIMCVNNLSPETVRCDCCDGDDVPELDYSVCEKDGFLGDVLQPIIDDRDAIKQRLRETDDPEEERRLEGRSQALKWVLVTCFGYQGFSNSKFGRIEVHEAINAHARDLMLDAKAVLEDGGWRILHGIVDSLWVTPMPDREQRPIRDVAAGISEQQGIALEYEGAFEWVAFVPLKGTQRTGALTRYFGKHADEEGFKVRGIAARQRSTPPYIEALQRDLIATLDETRDPAAVCDRLARSVSELRAGAVDVDELLIRSRCSKPLEAYDQRTRTVNALERYAKHEIPRSPGQDIYFVVKDDDRKDLGRVRLPFEDCPSYDEEFYVDGAIDACQSVVAPQGWEESDVREHLCGQRDGTIAAWG